MKFNHIIPALLLMGSTAWAQVPAPAGAQTKPVLLTGATLHVGNGTVIEKAAVAFEKGKITYAGPATDAPAGTNFDRVDVTGQHIYPGIIQPNTQLGLNEIESVRATVDEQEVGQINPNVRAMVAYNTDSDIIPTVRANGVLMIQVTPLGGTLSGSSSVMQLDAWNWEDAVVKADDGMHLNWPALPLQTQTETTPALTEYLRNREKLLQDLESLFKEASAYRYGTFAKSNFKLAALKSIFEGTGRLYLHADNAKEIIEGVRFVQKNGIKNVVLVGGRDAWRITDFLRDNNIPVILGGVHILPGYPADDTDLPYKAPFLLQQAGILYCLDNGSRMMHSVRNLPFMAGTTVAHGLTKEQALSAVTLNAAKILGIANQAGSIEIGKDATLVVSSGDLLDMRTNNVTSAYIQGRKINLTDKQKYLYQKFKEKYEAGK